MKFKKWVYMCIYHTVTHSDFEDVTCVWIQFRNSQYKKSKGYIFSFRPNRKEGEVKIVSFDLINLRLKYMCKSKTHCVGIYVGSAH